jgi:transposase
MLSRWKRQLEKDGLLAFGGSGNPRDEEIAALKRELARVKKERDFSREAAIFFARESSLCIRRFNVAAMTSVDIG